MQMYAQLLPEHIATAKCLEKYKIWFSAIYFFMTQESPHNVHAYIVNKCYLHIFKHYPRDGQFDKYFLKYEKLVKSSHSDNIYWDGKSQWQLVHSADLYWDMFVLT